MKIAGLNVICHGDLWRSNIMFDDCSPPSCILVDFQMLRYASPSLDIAQLLYVHADPECRRRFELSLLQYYYSALHSSVKAPAKIPTYDAVLCDYQERRIVGMAYDCLRWPASVMAKLDDSDALYHWYFNSRIEVYRSLMDHDPEYESRMRCSLQQLFDEAKQTLNL